MVYEGPKLGGTEAPQKWSGNPTEMGRLLEQKPHRNETLLAQIGGKLMEECERRRRAVEEARASNFRQDYVHDALLEDANARFIQGLISLEELRADMREAIENRL